MKRVLVIGSGGAGKTTFSMALAAKTGLPLIHLDRLFWKPGWVETPKAEWKATIRDVIARDRWILDGNYGGTLPERLEACDTVVFFDFPRLVCLRQVLIRRLQHLGRGHVEIAEECPERLTWSFVVWIWTYPSTRRAGILERLDNLRPDQRAVVLRSRSDARRFLETLG
ncbi:MAG: AAA family ATPase [Gemmatimonadetes bacterium]|nr:AAA family ATPase [Gemmatimonadota bacterium]